MARWRLRVPPGGRVALLSVDLLSDAEVAERAGVDEGFVTRLVEQGILRPGDELKGIAHPVLVHEAVGSR